MLVGVLNKKDVQKNKRSAFLKNGRMCATRIFDEWGRILENDWEHSGSYDISSYKNDLLITPRKIGVEIHNFAWW